MILLSDVGWLNVISTMGILIFGCTFGVFFFYKSRKSKIKLLTYLSIAIFLNGLWYWGNFWESLSLLFTGQNFDNTYGIAIPYELQAIMSFMWVAPSNIFFIYVGAELIIPKKKWYIVGFSLVMCIFWELFIFLDPLAHITPYIPVPGEDLVDEDLIPGGPIYLMALIIAFETLFFLGFGYLYKSIKSKGIIRKKFLFLSINFILAPIFGILEGSGIVGVSLFLVRVGMIFGFLLIYLGIKEEPEKVIKLPSEKEVKIEESLFRLTKRPAQITEEEVTFHRERKICLVCKGKISGFNIFICPSCDALYCQNCAQALSNLENTCWACNGPIDESKPVKPYKEEEEVDLKPSKKPKK